MADPKRIPEPERSRLLELRCEGKRGRSVSPEQLRWCERLLKKYPDDYRAVGAEMQKIIAEEMRFGF